MINGILGRIHLASDLTLLSERQFALVKEGVDCYKSLIDFKKSATPYIPKGFTSFGDNFVCAGLRKGAKAYLATWNLNGELHQEVGLDKKIGSVKVLYPQSSPVKIEHQGGALTMSFTKPYQAVLIEVEII